MAGKKEIIPGKRNRETIIFTKEILAKETRPIPHSNWLTTIAEFHCIPAQIPVGQQENRFDPADCFAVRLAWFLLGVVRSQSFHLSRNGYFKDDFYKAIIEQMPASGFEEESADPDLFIIYAKQCIQILRSSGLIVSRDGTAAAESDLPSGKLYFLLFHSFWNEVRWEKIFPSDPDAARELQASRNILKDMMLLRPEEAAIETLANEFFEFTGFSQRNNLFMISFLDFYFFTWLKHFGILAYHAGSRPSVRIRLTENGLSLLKSLS